MNTRSLLLGDSPIHGLSHYKNVSQKHFHCDMPLPLADAYSESCQTSKMELFAAILND